LRVERAKAPGGWRTGGEFVPGGERVEAVGPECCEREQWLEYWGGRVRQRMWMVTDEVRRGGGVTVKREGTRRVWWRRWRWRWTVQGAWRGVT
jgi:hypothetical protein